VYLNNNLSFDDLSFRTATPYLFAATRFDYNTGIAGSNSESPDQIAFNLPPLRFQDGVDYVAVLNGLPGDSQYPLEWHVFENAITNTENGIEVLFHNGSVESGDLELSLNGGEVLYEGLAYGDFQAYGVTMPSLIDYELLSSDPLVNLVGQSDWTVYDSLTINIFSSGAVNREGVAELELWAALPNGITFPLSALTQQTVVENTFATMEVYPNPSVDFTYVKYHLKEQSDLQFFVTNPQGQILYTMNKSDQIPGNYLEKIDVRHLPKGEYFISVVGNQGVNSKKIIVIH
jgi:hypothetical protein